MKIYLTLLSLLFISTAFSQQKVIDHTAYDGWKTLKSEQISNDGNYICYEINPHKGDGFLFIYNVKSGKLDSIPRASRASFSGNSNFLAFKIAPGYDTLRNCELEKVDKKKWPKDSMGIYILASDSLMKFDRISSFQVNDESDWITFLSEENDFRVTVPAKKKKRWCKKKQEPEYTSTGKLLTVFDPISGDRMEFKDVKSYEVSKNANQIAYSTHQKLEQDSISLNVIEMPGTNGSWTSKQKYTDLTSFSFNQQETQLAFLVSTDSAEVKVHALKLLDLSSKGIKAIADTTQAFLVEGDAVSTNYSPSFTKDGAYLYFGSAEKPMKEPKDTLIESEKVKLDLWHYKEQRLQPQQLLELKRDQRKTTLYAYDLASENTVQLSDDTLEMRSKFDLKGDYLFASSNQAYAHTYNWAIPETQEDHYRVSIKTGESELIRVGTMYGGQLSPSGNYYTFYDSDKHNHFAIDLSTKKEMCLTCSVDNVLWEEDINGMPHKAYPSGLIGWNKDESVVFIQSEFDIWEYNFGTNEATSTTNEEGSKMKIELRPSIWSYDSTYIDFENMYVTGFDRTTKGTHFYTLTQHMDHVDFNKSASYDARLYPVRRSKDKSQMMLRKMTAIDYPNLFLAEDFTAGKQISDANPQQKDYNWTTVELINWTSYDGFELEGLLYKPENYDANKEYPLMVYFYELYSDQLHSHYTPRPTASIVFPTEYASADYFVFIPDIRYKEGHPAKSAYDCIMSGTDRVLELYSNVDSTRMALQGQSWGGYQTAQLVTMTTRYKAAMAGAPVTNMFSAYGGIRWGSGLNRQFQYEHTQSRIGYTIWERPDLYVENSPQFHLPNVETPLLIMHNDGDGAVPWYQGIELYTGLKRLGKTTWMLNYNGEEHNLMQNANRIDLSIRMRQFFDHYLHDKAAPLWLTDGIPATVKGKELRY